MALFDLRVRGSVRVGTDNRDNQYHSPSALNNETSPFDIHILNQLQTTTKLHVYPARVPIATCTQVVAKVCSLCAPMHNNYSLHKHV